VAEKHGAQDRRAGRTIGTRRTGTREARDGCKILYALFRFNRWPARSLVAQRVLEKMRGIADAGFIVAFLNRSDRHHNWADSLAMTISGPLLTCEAVLAETAFQVGSVSAVLRLVQEGFLQLAFNLSTNLIEVADLANRYRDRNPDLADLCLIRMSELYEDLPVLTVDEKNFRVYRRNGREVIPIVCPPRR
jgi:uncharacterized protein